MITSYIAAYISGHVTKPVKDLLRKEAFRRRDRSMSRFISEAIAEMLSRRGYKIAQ